MITTKEIQHLIQKRFSGAGCTKAFPAGPQTGQKTPKN